MSRSKLFSSFAIGLSIISQAAAQETCCKPDPCSYQKAESLKGFIFEGSYLYWLAKEDGLEFAQYLNQTGGFPDQINVDVKTYEPKSRWNSGFQIGGGYIFPQRCQWDVFANWTSYSSKQTNFVASNDADLSQEMLRPIWLPLLMGTVAFNGGVSWKLDFNLIDLMIGRDFFAGPWFSFHPQAGVRIGWIGQKYKAEYQGAYIEGGVGIVPTGATSFKADWTFNGTGLRFGSDAQWHINSHFSIAGNAFLSALYGKYKLHEKFQGSLVFFTPAPVLLPEAITLKDKFNRLRACLEAEMGIRWQQYFSCNQRKVQLGIYYDFSYWIDQNMMVNQNVNLDLATGNSFVTNITKYGDLQLQGLRINAEIVF